MLVRILFVVAVLHIADCVTTTSRTSTPTFTPWSCSNQTELCGQVFKMASATREATFEYYACVRNLQICDDNLEVQTLKQKTLSAIVAQAACKDSAQYATAPVLGQSVLFLVSFLLTTQRLARHITLGN